MRTLLGLCILLSAQVCFAWGALGHRVVGELAERQLCPEARKELNLILIGESFANASTWADEIRDDITYKFASPWHFASVPEGMTYKDSVKSPKGDVVTSIKDQLAQVEDKKLSLDKRIIALKFLIHFVGDIHQPLHVGHYDDHGGNTIDVTWFGFPTNLHSVWDSGILNRAKLNYLELANLLEQQHKADPPKAASEIEDWAEESIKLRTQAYDIGDERPAVLSYTYYRKSVELERQRLWEAGQRLATLLNKSFHCEVAP